MIFQESFTCYETAQRFAINDSKWSRQRKNGEHDCITHRRIRWNFVFGDGTPCSPIRLHGWVGRSPLGHGFVAKTLVDSDLVPALYAAIEGKFFVSDL
jgi:hypothetical protein